MIVIYILAGIVALFLAYVLFLFVCSLFVNPKKEYEEIENYLYRLNLENGYIQELGEHEEEYVPNFNLDNV